MRDLTFKEVRIISGGASHPMYTDQHIRQWRSMAIWAAVGAATAGPLGFGLGLVGGALAEAPLRRSQRSS
jgi:hypothetical protein